LLPAKRLGRRKDACCTTIAAAVTAAASDRGGRLAAVGLSLLSASYTSKIRVPDAGHRRINQNFDVEGILYHLDIEAQ
jgi:hypothetical protein